jgi:Tfp pilus assembly protein PilN
MKAINLLPQDLRRTPKGSASKVKTARPADEPGGIGAFVVLGALAACVVALAAYVLTTNTVKDRQAQLDAITAQVKTTTQRVSQLKPYADFQQMAETRIQTVNDLASSRFDWEQALRDISRVVPADVTLTSLTGSISSGAAGGSTVRAAITAPAVELKGCTTDQKHVATLLSRLRGVDGATRVSLSKSTKPAKTANPAGPTPVVTGTQATGCGKGRPPAFEIVMFFERSTVPQSVEQITVQQSAGATPASGTTGAAGATPTGTDQPATGVTTPPADPAAAGTTTPASTPQGGGAK